MLVLLDAGPLGLVTHPRATPENDACSRWMESLLRGGWRVGIPEIADYEVRRELLRADKQEGLRRLDALKAAVEYLPITTQAMREAAAFWADARKRHRPTADDKALDADMILVAQALEAMDPEEVVIATSNVGHLARFAPAKVWWDIS